MDKSQISPHRIYLDIPYKENLIATMVPTAKWEPAPMSKWSFDYDHADELLNFFPDREHEIHLQIITIYEQAERVPPDTDRFNMLDKYNFKRLPKNHQVSTLTAMLYHNQYGIFLDMGLGKSQICVNFIDMLIKFEDPNYKAVIVCPKTVFGNWKREVKVNSDLDYVIVFGSKEERKELLSQDHNIYIINYEGVVSLRDYDFSRFDIVILDEVTKIKNSKAIRTEVITERFTGCKYKYVLTGTPVAENIIDLYALFFFLNPDFLGFYSFSSYRDHYCILDGYFSSRIVGYKDLTGLKEKIAQHSIRIKKSDVLPDLPDKIYHTRELYLEGRVKKQYETMDKKRELTVGRRKIKGRNILTKLTRLSQITSGHYLDRKRDNIKLTELSDIIEENKGGETGLVIWCRFRESMKLVAGLLDQKEISYSLIHGDIKNRSEQEENFQDGITRAIIVQLDTGGMGLNLQAGNLIIFYENDFKLINRQQAEERTYRIGTKTSPVYIDLIFKDTIDEKIIEAIRTKKEIADYLLDCYDKKAA